MTNSICCIPCCTSIHVQSDQDRPSITVTAPPSPRSLAEQASRRSSNMQGTPEISSEIPDKSLASKIAGCCCCIFGGCYDGCETLATKIVESPCGKYCLVPFNPREAKGRWKLLTLGCVGTVLYFVINPMVKGINS